MSIEIARDSEVAGGEEILTDEALDFVEQLHHRFDPRRRELLAARRERRERIARGERLDFLDETRDIRDGDWRVPPPPDALVDRRVEITGPASPAKMAINALNSGAPGVARRPRGRLEPHLGATSSAACRNLRDAARGTLAYTSPEGKAYALRTDVRRPTVVTRPRGWHLPEKHVLVDGERGLGVARRLRAALLPHRARSSSTTATGPFYYLPKLESHLEARLWNDVFMFARAVPRHPARQRPGDRAHRDDPRGVRDGRDPLRAARARVGPERRAAGTTCSASSRSSATPGPSSWCPTARRCR